MNWTDHITRGVIGIFMPLGAAIYSWQEHVEWGLRILVLAASLVATILTIAPMVRAQVDKLKKRRYKR